MLVVSLCKPVICKLKIFGVGNLVGGTIKREDQILKIQWGEAKEEVGGGHNFWPNFSGVKNLGGNYGLWVFYKIVYKTMEN